jgi:hypothetical protein
MTVLTHQSDYLTNWDGLGSNWRIESIFKDLKGKAISYQFVNWERNRLGCIGSEQQWNWERDQRWAIISRLFVDSDIILVIADVIGNARSCLRNNCLVYFRRSGGLTTWTRHLYFAAASDLAARRRRSLKYSASVSSAYSATVISSAKPPGSRR